MITIIVFALILSLLIFVHELGHFVTAKKAGIVVEEFGIGYPPRAIKVWQDEGKIGFNNQEFIIGRKTKVPKNLDVGSRVYVEQATRPDGKIEITQIEVISAKEDVEDDKPFLLVTSLEKPTEYSLNWIPFGGYVKMLGEEDPSAPGSFASKSKKARFTVLVAGAVMNLITAVIIFAIMFMTGQPEPIGPTYIVDVFPNTPAEQAGMQADDIVLEANGVKIQSSRDLSEFTDEHKGEEVTLLILRDGKQFELSLVPRENPPFREGAMGVSISTQYQLRITKIEPNTPAAIADLKVDDIIAEINGNFVSTPHRLVQQLHANQGESVTLSIVRNQSEQIQTQMQTDISESDLESLSSIRLGAEPIPGIGTAVIVEPINERTIKAGLGEALIMGLGATANIVVGTFYVPIAVIQKVIPAEDARPIGPVGIYGITEEAVEVSREENKIYPILMLTAILSTALAVTNLLPIPALDGGRILFILVEAIRGKRIAPEKEGAIHFIGLALLLTLMMVISFYDITNPIDVSGLFR